MMSNIINTAKYAAPGRIDIPALRLALCLSLHILHSMAGSILAIQMLSHPWSLPPNYGELIVLNKVSCRDASRLVHRQICSRQSEHIVSGPLTIVCLLQILVVYVQVSLFLCKSCPPRARGDFFHHSAILFVCGHIQILVVLFCSQRFICPLHYFGKYQLSAFIEREALSPSFYSLC